MSSIRLLILGVLQRKQPIHGYEVHRELEQWHADKWANVAYGSIYSALSKMAEEGLVKAINIDPCEKQNSRTEYIITAYGKIEFKRLLHEYWWELKPTIDPFQIALTFMDRLPLSELQEALRHRADQLHSAMMLLKHENLELGSITDTPRHLIASTSLMLAHMQTELVWIEETLGKIEHGELP